MPNTMVNGVDLYYECHGQGSPLMLIAGLASDSQSWLPVVEALARHHMVILPDNRGVGRTTPMDVGTSIGLIADDCAALIERLGLSPVHLLGHSMGGLVAMDCAIRHPERVAKLALAATSACNSARNNALFSDWVSCLHAGMDMELWFRSVFYWIFSRRFFENRETLDSAVRGAAGYPYPQTADAFERQVKAISEFDIRKDLTSIRKKTLVICGKEDLLFTPDESMKTLSAIPDVTFTVIENAAHSIHVENPGAFTDCLLRFLGNSK